MRRDLAMKWVEELRRGKYKQGSATLNFNDEEFCCLGVLCEIEGLRKEKLYAWGDSFVYKWGDKTEERSSTSVYPGKNLKTEQGGFNPEIVKIPKSFNKMKMKSAALSELNDHGYTFNQIADFIELNSGQL